ncbi:hypothetical protein WMF30_14975 [Sorangium sp. So ce134]
MKLSTLTKTLTILTALSFIGADDCAINQNKNQNKPVKTPESVPLAGEHSECGTVTQGEEWRQLHFEVGPLTDGYRVMLAEKPDGTGAITVDDQIDMRCRAINKVDRPLEPVSNDDVFSHTFDDSCATLVPAGPFDITHLFHRKNSVECTVTFKDLCGACKGSSDIWLAWVKSGPTNEEIDAAEDAIPERDNNHSFGLGVDTPTALSSTHWSTLLNKWRDNDWSLRTARTIIYLGADGKPMNMQPLRDWVNALKNARLDSGDSIELVVTVSVLGSWDGESRPPVSRKDFRTHFNTLVQKFPEVRYWGLINEPEVDLEADKDLPSWRHRADAAVEYFVDGWQVLRDCKLARLCSNDVMLVAGEFAYKGRHPQKSVRFWRRYGDQMIEAVKKGKISRFPIRWSFHPYADISGANTGGTDRFVRFLDNLQRKAKQKAKLGNKSLRAWLTETGTLLHYGPGCSSSAGDLNHDRLAQYNGARTVFRLNKKRRVDRIYWWDFKQEEDHVWDSAMVDSNNVPRTSFCALTHEIDWREECRGAAYATQCKETSR